MMEKAIDLNNFPSDYSIGCSNCHNHLRKYKYMCVTCKSPCLNCTERSTCNISTDTYDFQKYLESLTKKPKLPSKLKTVGTDTCDLECHFDYYKFEKATVIQKNVATDCSDLHYGKLLNGKKIKKSIDHVPSDKISKIDGNCNFWRVKCGSKTYSRRSKFGNTARLFEREPPDNEDEESSIISEEILNKSEENKENFNSEKKGAYIDAKTIDFDSSSSDESDLDLLTSSKVIKCRQIARTHKLTLLLVIQEGGKVFKCSICGKTFSKKYLGTLHLEDHVDGDQLKCLSCDCNFENLDSLTSHVKEVHRGLVANNSGNLSLEDDERKVTDECMDEESSSSNKTVTEAFLPGNEDDKEYECGLCPSSNGSPLTFPSFKALHRHKRIKHLVKEIKHRPSTERKPRLKREFICLFCGKEFKSRKALSDHLPVHTGEKNHLCDICHKSYTTSANLKIHKRTHMGVKNFKCTVCEKAFHKKDSLKVHFRKHSGERPFQCDLCPMTFDRNFILKNHRLRHFSEKTYICPVCGKAFTTHGGLNNHEKSHKRDPGARKPRKPAVKPTLEAKNAVICDVCGKVYSTRSNLRIHKLIHLGLKPFQCPVCHQHYAKKDSMLTHMRKHTDERPFTCETCGMAFYRNHTLKTHRLRHTGERPHKCHMCGKSFTQSSSLTYHIKHHSRKEDKRVDVDAPGKGQKRKTGMGKSTGKTIAKEDSGEKRCEVAERPTEMVLISDENGMEYHDKIFAKNASLILPVVKKEILIRNDNVPMDNDKRDIRSGEIIENKDGNQLAVNKFNYYIAKNVTVPKIGFKNRDEEVEEEGRIRQEHLGENLILAKGNLIRKDENVLTTNGEIWAKGAKEDFGVIMEPRNDGKPDNVLPVAGEILNATFISDDNGEVIPFGSMSLQSVNAENIVISPLIKVESGDEGDKRKGMARCSRVTVIDSKMKYHTPSAVSKTVAKTNCQILNLKDTRVQLINSDPLSFHIQVPVSCTAVTENMLSGITPTNGYFGNV